MLPVHGWGGRGGQLAALVPGLVDAGYAAVTFDGPAHGASEGDRTSLVEHARPIEAMARAVGGRLAGVVAHAMGAPPTALALRAGVRADRVVFVAPPFAATDGVNAFTRGWGLPAAVRDRPVARAEARLGVRFADLTMARTAPAMDAALLVIHDEDDREVPFADGARIARIWRGARLLATRGLGHTRILAAPPVVKASVAFVTAR